MMLDQNEDPEQLAIIKHKYGFDQPVLTQYGYYLNDLSPISIHQNTGDGYTSLASEKYTYTKLIDFGMGSLVLRSSEYGIELFRIGLAHVACRGTLSVALCLGH